MVERRRGYLRGVATAGCALVALLAAATPASAQSEPDPERFQKVVLVDTGLVQPMRLSVAGDGRVIYIQRDGRVHVWEPDTQDSALAGTLPTQVVGETGLIGLTLATDFDTTGHIYLNRSLPGFNDSTSPNFRQQRVSRYTLSDDNVLDVNSEVPIIQTTNAGGGGHSGGDLEMTPDGLLYITTGDNTGCCASFGFAPHDERPGRESHDAQRTSGNTNNLNGKLLRIRPLADGGYDIPAGNLFTGNEEGGGKTRPEIYAMGFRNLFSIGGYDEATNAPWIADYGPDAVLDGERGPRGYVRGMLVTEAANYGWPYCTANNVPYTDWDYENNVARGPFDCAAPVNDSPNNTGLVNLPPIKPANIYYSYTSDEPWPMLYGGGLHALDRYNYDPGNPSETKFPEWFDDRFFFSEFTANYVGSLRFAADRATPEDVRLHFPTMQFGSPFDARFGPDGSLYMIEFGSNNFSSTKTTPAIYRIDYVSGNRVPLVRTSASTDSGPAPLAVAFDASETTDPDGDDLTFEWDFTNDGTVDATGPTVSHTFTELGEHTTRVTVTDENGGSAIGNLRTIVGNSRPVVEFLTPIDGGFHELTGGPISYKLRVTDAEDGSAVDCTKVRVEYLLGHDRHQHPVTTSAPNADCEGSVTPGTDGSHGGTAYLYHVVTASYTDAGGRRQRPAAER
jgi:glucose/arabinose dehydrogenase